MIIAIASNSQGLANIAAKIVANLLSNLNVEIKGMNDIPNYRPNKLLFGNTEGFDNWVVVLGDNSDLAAVKQFKPLTIFVEDVNLSFSSEFNEDDFSHKIHSSSAEELEEDLIEILVSEKLLIA